MNDFSINHGYVWLCYRSHCTFKYENALRVFICCPMDLNKLAKDSHIRLLCSPSKTAHCISNESRAPPQDIQGLVKCSPCLLLGRSCPHRLHSVSPAFLSSDTSIFHMLFLECLCFPSSSAWLLLVI